MKHALAIMVGAALILLLATLTLVAMPYVQMSTEAVPEELEPYTPAQQRGRDLYIANGCLYCHSQQPRDPGLPDHMCSAHVNTGLFDAILEEVSYL